MPKKKVYVETTVISDATALPSRDVVQLGRQIITKAWWTTASLRFDLYPSIVVAKEIRRGDPEAVRRRVSALEGIPELDVTAEDSNLARQLINGKAVPKEYPDDAFTHSSSRYTKDGLSRVLELQAHHKRSDYSAHRKDLPRTRIRLSGYLHPANASGGRSSK